jgi:hypothetical protein
LRHTEGGVVHSNSANPPGVRLSGRYSVATVLADGIETRYVRTGVGPTVVLVRPLDDRRDRDLETLGFELAQRFRLIVPTVPAALNPPDTSGRSTVRWLRGLLDGIGLADSAIVLVDRDMAHPALELARQEPDRLRGVVILDDLRTPAAVATAVAGLFGMTLPAA